MSHYDDDFEDGFDDDDDFKFDPTAQLLSTAHGGLDLTRQGNQSMVRTLSDPNFAALSLEPQQPTSGAATMADLQIGLALVGAEVLNRTDAALSRVTEDRVARAAKDDNPLSRRNLCAGMSSDEQSAIEAEWPAVEEYLAAAATYAKFGMSLSEYVASSVTDRSGSWPGSVAVDLGGQVSPHLDSALSKASAIVRQSHPILSATGMYRE